MKAEGQRLLTVAYVLGLPFRRLIEESTWAWFWERLFSKYHTYSILI